MRRDDAESLGPTAPTGPPDVRMPLLGLAAWLGALAAAYLDPHVCLAVLVSAVVGVVGCLLASRWRVWVRSVALTATAMVLVAAAVAAVALARADAVRHGPVARLAESRALVVLEGQVTADPRVVAGRFGDRVLVRVRVSEVDRSRRRGRRGCATRSWCSEGAGWEDVRMGETVRFTGRLGPASDDVAAVATPRGPPERIGDPGPAWRATEALRAAIRESVAHRPEGQRALVPALVDGDDADMPEHLRDDFRTTGLTHLTAVSGTNLTLVVGFLLVVARWAGVRGRWLALVGAFGIVGFVLLARTEPSVLRAAAMGTVALVGLGRRGLHRGVRGLGVAVVGLLLLDPGLATTAGFALSVLATAGILFLAPRWRDALARWLPRWVAEAVAVPAAAQLACTPLVAAISGQVSLVAVAANLAVAPVVGPATVLGLLGGLVGLVSGVAGRVVGTAASWCVAWIIAVAEHGAALPGAAIGWRTTAVSLALLVGVTAAVAWAGPLVLAASGFRCRGLRAAPGRHRGGAARLPAGRPTGGCSRPATSARATRSCSAPDPAPAWWSTPDPTPGWSTPACAGSASLRSRWSCSPTSTPTTSTGWRECWTTGRWARST